MIVLKNLELRRGSKILFSAATITIHTGEKVALVGRNGAGKSSLFALLGGKLHEDSGDFSLPRDWLIAEVAQDMPEVDDTATDFVLAGDTRLQLAQQALQAANASGDGMEIAHAHMALDEAGAHDAESRAQSLLLGLGFRIAELSAPVNSFSGGWRMRLQLARALMCPSDLLLLDEPTNHLDLDALVWLEQWLAAYTGTLIVISHDRAFLDASTRVTLHIENGSITRYGGNYSTFEVLRAQALEQQGAAFAKQQERIAHLQKFIDRFKAKASKAKQAQSRVKALEKMERLGPVHSASDFAFDFKAPTSLPNPMLSLRDARMGYRDAQGVETTILHDIKCSLLAGQRIGILGANGQGKSTFVKSLVGSLPLLAGQKVEGKGLTIGYFAQHELDVLDAQDSPLGHLQRLVRDRQENAREQQLRNFLGQFQFKDSMATQNVGSMSGGEKARLVLALLAWQAPNLLVLDEPTNHLDIETRAALSMAINGFDGSVLLVSHDRSLLCEVCDDFWLVSRGGIAPFDGDMDDYQRYLLDQARQATLAANAQAKSEAKGQNQGQEQSSPQPSKTTDPSVQTQTTPAPAPAAALSRKEQAQQRQEKLGKTQPLKKRLGTIEKELEALQQEQTNLHQSYSENPSPAQLAEQGKRLKEIEQHIADLEEQWLLLGEQLQQIESAY